jgi:hypothetical protein
MKKIALIFIACLMSLTIQAQKTEHLKFMGIPLNGSIENFQQKMIEKGCSLNTKVEKSLPKGSRAYEGTFIRKNADFVVYYDNHNNVYSAKAYFNELTKTKCENEFNEVLNLLKAKYPGGKLVKIEDNGLKNYSIGLSIGEIIIYMRKSENPLDFMRAYSLHIQYVDYVNSAKNDKGVLDDL